jgi:hypothetical protein
MGELMFHAQILKDLDAAIRSLLTSYDHHKGLARAHGRHALRAGRPCECQQNERYHAERAAEMKDRAEGMRRLLDHAQAENAATTTDTDR